MHQHPSSSGFPYSIGKPVNLFIIYLFHCTRICPSYIYFFAFQTFYFIGYFHYYQFWKSLWLVKKILLENNVLAEVWSRTKGHRIEKKQVNRLFKEPLTLFQLFIAPHPKTYIFERLLLYNSLLKYLISSSHIARYCHFCILTCRGRSELKIIGKGKFYTNIKYNT